MILPLKYKGKGGRFQRRRGGQVVREPGAFRAPPAALGVDLDTAAAREENETQDGCHTELLGCVT